MYNSTAVTQKKYRIEGRAKGGGKITRFNVLAFDLDEAATIARERYGIIADTIALFISKQDAERDRRDAVRAYAELID